jgi:hypothetical protein
MVTGAALATVNRLPVLLLPGDIHSLLASRLVVRKQIRTFVVRLTDPGHDAVAEDPEAAAEELVLQAVPLGVLLREEAYERLRRDRSHAATSASIASSTAATLAALSGAIG